MPIDRIKVTVPADGIRKISQRVNGLEATALCIAATIDSGDDEAKAHASTALRSLAEEISRLYCDLDVATWPEVQS